MSKETKKVPEKSEKASATVPTKVERAIRPRRQAGPTSMLATFDNMLDDFRRRFMESFWTPFDLWPIEPYGSGFTAREAYSDLVDEGNKFLVCAEVPGIPKDKINITVTTDSIEISGEAGAEKEEKEKNYVVRGRTYSNVYKRLEFPEEVIPDKAEATVKDGILMVDIPKKTPVPEAKKYKVEVKEAK